MNKIYLKPAEHLEPRRQPARQNPVVFRIVLFLIAFVTLTGISMEGWGINITPIHTGTISTFTTWTHTSCAQGNASSNDYIQMLTATSAVISPAMDFSLYSSQTLDFKARTYGGPSTAQATITVSISTNNGSSWTVLGTRIPTTTTLTAMTQFDLSSYTGTQVLIKLVTLGAESSKGVGIDDINISGTSSATPTIVLNNTSFAQINTDATPAQGTTKVILSKFKVDVTVASATLNALAFKTSGTYTGGGTTDISKLELYYSATFTMPGSSLASSTTIPTTGNTVTFSSLSTTISNGTSGYFWITADIASGATVTKTIGSLGTGSSGLVLTFASGTPTGTISDPALQTITAGATPSITLADNGAQITAANVNQGTTNHVIHKSSLAVASANTNLTGMTCTTNGTYILADVTNLKVWYSTDNVFSSGTDVLLSTLTTPGAAGGKTFPSFASQVINAGATGYIFITADIAAGATAGNTIYLNALATTDFTFSSGNKSGSTTASGAQTFVTAPTGCGSETFTNSPLTGTSYSSGSYTGDNSVTWYYTECNNSTTINGKAITLAKDATAKVYSASVPNGCGSLTLSYSRPYTTALNAIVYVNSTNVGTISGSPTQNVTQTFTVNNVNISGNVVIKIQQAGAASGQLAIDDISWTCYSVTCTAPATQASALSFSSIGTNGLTLSWTNGSGSKRIVIMNTSNSFTNPSGGTNPTADPTYAGSGEQVVYNDAGNSVSITGLTPGTTYWFRVYEYNCTGTGTVYNTTTASGNPASQATTACSAPATQASTVSFTSIGTNQLTVNWANGNGSGRVVIMNTTNTFTNPSTGTTPSANAVYGGSGEQVVYNNSGSSVTVTGLTPGTTYWFRVYEYNCTGTYTVYNTTTPSGNPASQATTACAAPSVQASSITFTSIGSDQMTVNWANGNGSNRIVIINTSNSFTPPVNSIDPVANAIYSGTGEQVVYNGSGTSVNVTGLDPSTQYFFKVFESNCTGTSVLFSSATGTGNPASATTTSSLYSACGIQAFDAGITEPAGWQFTGISSTYNAASSSGAASPAIKFDDQGDAIVTADVNNPSQLSFWIKGYSTDASSAFTVEGWNGGSWVVIETISPVSTTETTKTYYSVSAYTKFRFTYSNASPSNAKVSFDDVNITCGTCVLTTFPQLETFDEVSTPNLPCGWTMSNNNGDSYDWITASDNPHSGANSMYIEYNVSTAMNDWFYTPKLTMAAGTYTVSFYYRAGLNSYPEKLEVKWGAAATPAGMTNGPIFTNASIANESYVQGTGTFTVVTAGDYYVGFHGYSDADMFELYVDDILIAPCAGVPTAPVAAAATSIGGTYFTANWAAVSGATKYYLDVSTSSTFAAGSFVTGFSNKDVGNITTYNVSGLNTNTTYYYRARANNACGTSVHSNYINLTTLATTAAATIGYGDLVILAVNANMGADGACVAGSFDNGDEISFMCFVDITNGTKIQMTDNGYERNYTGSGQWGNSEGGAVLTRTGSTIPAGTVITFRTDMNNIQDIVFISPDADWVESDLGTYATVSLFNLNNGGDQIYMAQDGQWNGGTSNCVLNSCPPSVTGSSNCHNATFPGTGRLLFAFSTNPDHPWEASCANVSTDHDKPTQRSNLYPGMECLNMAPTGSSDYNKYVGPLTDATQREWIDRINNESNWSSYINCATYQSSGPQYDDGMVLGILPGGFSDGHWNGSADINWFNCANWQSMRVPDQNTNVVIPQSGVLNEPTIGDPTVDLYVSAECNDIEIQPGRTLTMNHANSRLDIYGNWIQNGTLSFTNGLVNFKDDNSTLSGSGNMDFYNLAMVKTATTNTLTTANDININKVLTLTSGIITTGTNWAIANSTATSAITGHATLGSAVANSYINGNLRRNVLSTGSYDFPVGTAAQYEYANIKLNSSTGLGYIDAFFTAPHTTPIDISPLGLYVNSDLLMELLNYGYWTITPDAGTYNYDVTLTSRGHTNQGLTAGSHAVIKRPNGASPWVTQGTHDNATQSMGTSWNWVTAKRTALTVFSDFAIAKNNVNSPLPVELLSFSATCDGQNIDLSWTTASESNNAVFTIERSSDAVKWEFVGTVNGNGNSNTRIDYAFSDHNPLSGTAYYRLKQTDYDGRSETFSPIAVICGENADGQGISYYPNPFTSEIQVNLSNVDFKNAVIRVYDMLGNMVFEKNLTAADAESRSTKLNLADLKVGIYTVEFKSESFTNVAKVVKNNYSTRY